MTDLRKAAEQPEQWKTCRHCGFDYKPPKANKWFPLAQPEQEPVAWHEPGAFGNVTTHKQWAAENGWLPLYTAPPKREWVGLTDEEIWGGLSSFNEYGNLNGFSFAQWIEAKLKDKNNADA